MSDICVSNILPSRTRSGICRSRQSTMSPFYLENEKQELKDKAAILYSRQINYVKNPGNRENKFNIMSEYQSLSSRIKKALEGLPKEVRTINEIQEWVEFLCWHTRISVFHQSVCVA